MAAVSLILLTLLGAVVVLLAILLWTKLPSKRLVALVNQIPGPPTIPVLGNAHMFKTGGADFFDQVITFSRQYSTEKGLFRAWVGTHLVVLATKADTAEVLLKSSKHITKSYLYGFLHPWLGTGLLTSTNAKWHARRKLITPTFHFKILEDFLQVFNEQSVIMQKRLELMAAKSQGFDIMPYITLCTLDIICDTAMGKHVNAQANSDSEYVKAIYKISELIMERIKQPWTWPDFLFRLTSRGREHDRLLKVLHSFTNEVIIERTEQLEQQIKAGNTVASMADKPTAIGGRKRLAFLDMLLYAAQTNSLTSEDIREEVDTFMFEGHDTTAAAVSWAVHLIGNHPDVQDKIVAELDQVFGQSDRAVTMDDIKQLKYLECCIKESLRLYPSVPMFAREIAEDCTMGGFYVPKGATLVVLTSEVHRDPEHFPEPSRFNPDRWLIDNSAGHHPFCFIPFSAGLRNCIGQKFAMIEEKVLLSSILRRYRITSLQKLEDIVPTGALILRSTTGVKVKLEKRHQAAA
jgi:cytochrome P450 family 4 subfamily V